MKQIKSDILIAQQLGTALKTGAEALISIADAYKDEQTKLLGNDSAHHAIALSQNKVKDIWLLFNQFPSISKPLQRDFKLLMRLVPVNFS